MWGRGIRLFRFLGFEIRLDWSWLIIALLVTWSLARGLFPAFILGLAATAYWGMAIAGAAGLFASILLHELGHSVVARYNGVTMRRITLFVFGGVAEMEREPPSPKSEFLIAIAGPVTSALLGLALFLARLAGELVLLPVEVLGVIVYLTWMNFVLAVFNLVPAFPLDGGRILRSALWAWRKNLRWSTRVAANISTGFALVLIFLGVYRMFRGGDFIGGMWWVIIGFFVRSTARMSYQQVILQEVLAGESVRRFMNSNPVTVPGTASVRELVENYLYRYPHKMFPVVQDGQLIGCVTMKQLRDVPREEWEHQTAQSLAVPCSAENTISPEVDAAHALSRMRGQEIQRLMVVDDQRLLGVVTLKDLLHFLALKLEFDTPPAGA